MKRDTEQISRVRRNQFSSSQMKMGIGLKRESRIITQQVSKTANEAHERMGRDLISEYGGVNHVMTTPRHARARLGRKCAS